VQLGATFPNNCTAAGFVDSLQKFGLGVTLFGNQIVLDPSKDSTTSLHLEKRYRIAYALAEYNACTNLSSGLPTQ
jgi:hypothetical protein